MTNDKLISTHSFCFNEQDNGGESITLLTKLFDNGDKKDNIHADQKLTLQSYCNSASFNFSGAPFSPETLRELANELEAQLEKAKLQ